jgi:leucyl aminopeptidase
MMQAKNYYQTNIERAIPLMLLTKAECQDNFPSLTPLERNCLAAQQFKGNVGDIGTVYDKEGILSKVYIGCDNNNDALAIASVANRLPAGCYIAESVLSAAALVAWSLAQYQFDKYKKNEIPPRILTVQEHQLTAILAEANAIFLVRDLINTPANDMGPRQLADVVATVAEEQGAEFKQWVGNELLSENFPAIHAVGRAAGSDAAPRLISLTWGKKEHPRVTLVGKGVCFDTGGLDIKPAAGMRTMKKDMGGSAQVIGLAQWLMTHKVPIRLQVLIPAVENSVSSDSYRPGDVLTMRNGLTVEIHNTDAEGRLVLADALVKACEEKPALLISFATLTGAARVAMGTEIAAMFTNDDKLAKGIIESSEAINDPVWRMPLYDGYADLLSSKIADIANASDSAFGGAITAALFLKRFVAPEVSWTLFDIMAWNVCNKPGRPEGGEAMGMRAVAHYLRERYK